MVDLKCAALANIPYSQMLRSMTRDARPIYAFLRPHLGVATQEFWKENLALLSHGFNGCGLIDIRLRADDAVFAIGTKPPQCTSFVHVKKPARTARHL